MANPIYHEVVADPRAFVLGEGLTQLDSYLNRLSLDTGTLVIFDRRPKTAPVTDRTTITGSPPGPRCTAHDMSERGRNIA